MEETKTLVVVGELTLNDQSSCMSGEMLEFEVVTLQIRDVATLCRIKITGDLCSY